jgi:hypothetical protein
MPRNLPNHADDKLTTAGAPPGTRTGFIADTPPSMTPSVSRAGVEGRQVTGCVWDCPGLVDGY